MKILYLHPAGAFGGASKSLIELYLAANKHKLFDAYVLTPGGTAADAFSDAGMNVFETIGLTQFDNTRFGYYRKLRWLILLRELIFLPATVFSLMRLKRLKIHFDLIHANEITLLPTVILAKWLLNLPVVMHVRSLQSPDINSVRSRWIYTALKKYVSALICIDETVKKSIPGDLKANVIHNGIVLSSADLFQNKGHSAVLTVGMAGVMHRSKGVYEFLEAAKILIKDRHRKVRFILAGDNARNLKGFKKWILQKLGFSEDVLGNAVKYVIDNDLQNHVTFPGYVKDIREFYPQLDILCFPSFLNACGRPVFEAAFFGVPSIVAIKNPVEDALIHEHTGIAIDEPDALMLANAIDRLLLDNSLRIELGNNAKYWAEKFYSVDKNSRILLGIYEQLCNHKLNDKLN